MVPAIVLATSSDTVDGRGTHPPANVASWSEVADVPARFNAPKWKRIVAGVANWVPVGPILVRLTDGGRAGRRRWRDGDGDVAGQSPGGNRDGDDPVVGDDRSPRAADHRRALP